MKKLTAFLLVIMSTVFAIAATTAYTSVSAVGRLQHADVYTYTLVPGGNDGQQISVPSYKTKSIQVSAVSGVASVAVQGSNDGVTWVTLTDTTSAGAVIALTAPGMKVIREMAMYTRPLVTGGASAAATIHIFAAGD